MFYTQPGILICLCVSLFFSLILIFVYVFFLVGGVTFCTCKIHVIMFKNKGSST